MNVECLLVILLIYRYRPDLPCWQLAGCLAALGAWSLFVIIFPVAWMLQSMQLCATVLSLGAVLPQIWLNCQQGCAGEYSPITAAMATFGNLLRVYTTSQLVSDDILLLGCYFAGVVVQGALFIQIVVLSMLHERLSLFDVLLSDFQAPSGSRAAKSRDFPPAIDEEHSLLPCTD